MNRRQFLILLMLLLPLRAQAGDEPGKQLAKKQAERIAALIDKLADTANSDFGYSPTIAGSIFLPVDSEGQYTVLMLFQRPPVSSNIMRELVKHGAAAVPLLLEHLTDKRRTKILITQGPGMFWIHEDEVKEGDKKAKKEMDAPGPRHSAHAVTVGDLCYVALGQIVNRTYSAVSYIPSGNIGIMSPTHAPSIAKELRAEWGGLTPAKHRASLLADLMQRENNYRRIPAAKRLGYYYPEALAEPVIKLLKRPVFDVFIAESFARDQLYRAKDAKEARALFEAFLKKEGEAYRHGIQLQLFSDLETLEANEEGRLSPPLKDFQDQPRRLLIQLYGKDKSVRGKDAPKGADKWSNADLVPFVREGLSYSGDPAIDAAVRDLLRSTKIDWVASACIEHLIGRGFDDEIEQYLQTRGQRKDLQEAAKTFRASQGWTRLHLAVEKKYSEQVERWIAAKKDVNVSSRSGQTPLHLAAAAGSDDIVALLLAAKAKVDVKNKLGQTALELAVSKDHLESARLLLTKGATPTDILAAAFAGRTDLVKRFLENDRAALRQTSEQKWTPLHLAVWEGKSATVSFLLRQGAPPNAADESGWTPLHLAAQRGFDEILRTLLEHKADVTATTGDQGQEPLTIAVQAGRLSAAKILVEHKADPRAKWSENEYSLLHVAASEGHCDTLAWLLTLGLPLEVRDKRGNTPLHYATKFGRADCVQFLLQKKANVNAKTEWDERPLLLAISSGHIDVVRILLKQQADTNWKNGWDQSPAEIAEAYDQPEIAKLLRKTIKKK
jgi:ankyrin repeat protein